MSHLEHFSKQQVQSLQPQHILQQQQPDGSMISFVTTAGQTHHVSAAAAAAAANHHIDLHQGKTVHHLSVGSLGCGSSGSSPYLKP